VQDLHNKALRTRSLIVGCAIAAAVLTCVAAVLAAVQGLWTQAVIGLLLSIFLVTVGLAYRRAFRRDLLPVTIQRTERATDGKIALNRQRSGRRDRMRPYRVLVDNELVGMVGDQEVQIFSVSPGEHTVWLKLDWTTSNKVKVLVGDTEQVSLVCRPGGGDLSAGFDAIFKHRRYIELELLQNQHQS
jgi:hypothetical protein